MSLPPSLLVFILLTPKQMIWVDKYIGKLTAQINSGTGETSYINWTDGGVVAVVRKSYIGIYRTSSILQLQDRNR
jgi:hypothetical protein